MRRRSIIAASLLLSSCGGGSGSENSAGGSGVVVVPVAPTPTPTPTPTPSPAPLTGAAADSMTLTVDSSMARISFAVSDLPSRQTPYVLGVGTHFAATENLGYDPAKSVAKFGELHMTSYRDDIFWNAFAPDWDLNGAHLPSALTSIFAKSSARPLLILNNGNPYVPGTSPPVSDAGRAAFAAFARRAADATSSENPIYEIWNEWNKTAKRQTSDLVGTGDASDYRASLYYAPLAIAAVDAVKSAHPGSPVLVGASGDDPDWAWTRDIVARGALRRADGLSVHLYNHCQSTTRRTALEMVDRMESLQSGVTSLNGGTPTTIYVTEWGWPTGTAKCAVSNDFAAYAMPQFLLHSAALPWVGGSWVYQLKDQGTNAGDLEQNFGLYDYDFAPKPQQCTLADAASIVAGAKAMRVIRSVAGLVVIEVASANGVQVLAWSTDPTRQGRITVGGTIAFSARRMCQAAGASGASRDVDVGAMPVVIDVPGASQIAIAAKLL